jgi:hypothetical protein
MFISLELLMQEYCIYMDDYGAPPSVLNCTAWQAKEITNLHCYSYDGGLLQMPFGKVRLKYDPSNEEDLPVFGP